MICQILHFNLQQLRTLACNGIPSDKLHNLPLHSLWFALPQHLFRLLHLSAQHIHYVHAWNLVVQHYGMKLLLAYHYRIGTFLSHVSMFILLRHSVHIMRFYDERIIDKLLQHKMAFMVYILSLHLTPQHINQFVATVVLRHRDPELLEATAREVMKVFERAGCSAQRETMNNLEAFLGSLPGHGQVTTAG